MKYLFLFLLLLPLSLIGQVESQFNGTLNVFSGSRIGSTNTFTISGIFSSTTSQYVSTNSATGDIVQVQSGSRFYWMHIYSIASNAGGVITCNVRDSSSTLTTFPLGKWSIFRPTTNLRLPLSPDGETNASRSSTFNTLAMRVDEIQTAVVSATNCEQTFTKASHGFRKGTPVFWNGSTYIRPTADSLVPDFVVVDSLTLNTFKVANCGTYTTALANGLYWFTSASPGYSLTQDTTKVPLFQALNGKMILNPIVGFNLMSGGDAIENVTYTSSDSTSTGGSSSTTNGVVNILKYTGNGTAGVPSFGYRHETDSIYSDVNVKMDNVGNRTYAIGYWPDFPSRDYNNNEYGLLISDQWNGEVTLAHRRSSMSMYDSEVALTSYNTARNKYVGVQLRGIQQEVNIYATKQNSWQNVIKVDTIGVTFSDNVTAGAIASYKFPLASVSKPSSTAGAISNLTWTAGTPSFLRSQHGVATGTTDGSGDLTVTFSAAMPDATYSLIATVEGTTSYTISVHTKATGTCKVRFFNPTTGMAVTATSVTISYEAKDY